MDDPFVNGQFRLDSSRLWSLINGTGDLIATARAYHDLRDAVLGLHFRDARGGCATCIDPDGFSVWWPCETAAVVARVERGES